jgi:hypothetical protein
VNKDLDCASDHLPIETNLEYSLSEAPQETRRKFRAMDEKEKKVFTEVLRTELQPCRDRAIHTRKDLDQLIDNITTAIQTATETVPT